MEPDLTDLLAETETGDTFRAVMEPRKARATVADVEEAYRRGAQQAAYILLVALTDNHRIEYRLDYLKRLARWRFGSIRRRPPLPWPSRQQVDEIRSVLGAPAMQPTDPHPWK